MGLGLYDPGTRVRYRGEEGVITGPSPNTALVFVEYDNDSGEGSKAKGTYKSDLELQTPEHCGQKMNNWRTLHGELTSFQCAVCKFEIRDEEAAE